MLLMPGNDGSFALKALAAEYNTPDNPRIGWLMGPKAWKNPQSGVPYALDNDCFTERDSWFAGDWCDMVDHAWGLEMLPRWVLVPDVVGSREGTLARWERYNGFVRGIDLPTAFAVQDGMTPADVPKEADVVFVGGSTEWKWRTAAMWCQAFPRVHIGRVNTIDRLFLCEDIGAESVDGTGWFRNPSRPNSLPELRRWLSGDRSKAQQELALEACA